MIKLHSSQDGQFYFTLCNTKGQVRLTSETYVSRSNRNREVLRLNKQLLKPVKIVDTENYAPKKHKSKHASKYL